MYGFGIVIHSSRNKAKVKLDSLYGSSITVRSKSMSADIYANFKKKFFDDKFVYEDENIIAVLDGVIFNKKELIKESGEQLWSEAFSILYLQKGHELFNEFRGFFSGIIYDKIHDKWIVFNDPTGTKQIFYSVYDDIVVISSSIEYVYNYLRRNQNTLSLSQESAYMLLSYGYLLDEFTLFNEIKKLLPARILVLKGNLINQEQYHRFSNEITVSLSNREVVENLDLLFREAIKRQFDKDYEHGYKHLVALSGGLDSRMTTWVSHDMGYKEIVNFTFSQSGYLDHEIARKIVYDLGHKWIFKSLNNGGYLAEQLEEVVKLNYGSITYSSLAHGKSLYDEVDFHNFGIIHTGHLGDGSLGSYYENISQIGKPAEYRSGAFSKTLINRIEGLAKEIGRKYPNTEMFKIYERGFSGMNQGIILGQNYSESFSPFYDNDFLEFCLSIPAARRLNRDIYKLWIKNKYPEAGKYKWETTGKSIYSPSIKIKGKRRYIPELKNAFLQRLKAISGFQGDLRIVKNAMAPIDYWYSVNNKLRIFVNDYYKSNIDRLSQYPDLMRDSKLIFERGNTKEKSQVLTLLALLKLFLGE